MKEINWILVTDEKVYGFDEFIELEATLKKFHEEGKKAVLWAEVRDFVRELEHIDDLRKRVESTLRKNIFHFRTVLNRNGVYKDGTPRLSISIPRKKIEEVNIDLSKEYEVLVFLPYTFTETFPPYPLDDELIKKELKE